MNNRKLYEGCIKTPPLWFGNSIHNIEQFLLDNQLFSFDSKTISKLRLGKLVERFICYQLQQDPSVKIFQENLQIQNNKKTIGELDCLFLQDQTPIHLEIIYKFYLYDDSFGNSELEYWIGPNRKDSLIQKLEKLKNKQLPLLYSNHTDSYLRKLNINSDNIKQNVCFKAQLFRPYTKTHIVFNKVNPECVNGFYLNEKQLNDFSGCEFNIPKKLDWLLEPKLNITWHTFNAIIEPIKELLNIEKSPMLWIKKPNGELLKCFIVWW